MELVYLWVEKYKNIENQGFNFSPRFNCKYDKDSNELIIDENKDYVSIFPDNINITAIVGENGSGKSSIAELLGEFNWSEFHEPNKNYLVFFNEDKFIFRCNLTSSNLYFDITNNTKYENETVSYSRELFISYFANNISTFLNKNIIQNKNYEKLDAMKDNSGQQMMENNKLRIPKEKILEYELFNKRFQSILSENEDLFQYLNQDFIFNNKKREIHFYEIGAITVGEDKNINKLFKESPYTGRTLFKDKEPFKEIPHETYFYKYLILNRLINIDDDKIINLEELIENIKEIYQKEILEDNDYIEILTKIRKENPINDEEYNLENVKKLLSYFEYKGNNIWIEKNPTSIGGNSTYINSLLTTINQYHTIRVNYFHDDNEEYNYLALSSGEREYIKLFTHYIYHLKNSDRRDVFYFDEPDLALHPNWQKRLVKDFIYFANKFINEKEIQLILTSHSPFLLSDIPKEHVVFLQKGEQKQPFKDKQTFGANIHTLLSDGFFMDGGLMGEFAKGKIEEIKKFYDENKDLKQEDISFQVKKDKFEQKRKSFHHIQSIIGEPFLQTVIKNYLDELEQIFDNKSFKKNEIEEFIKEFGKDEIKAYLESQND